MNENSSSSDYSPRSSPPIVKEELFLSVESFKYIEKDFS